MLFVSDNAKSEILHIMKKDNKKVKIELEKGMDGRKGTGRL